MTPSTVSSPKLPQTLRIGPFRVKSFGAQALAGQLYRQLALGRRTELFFANTNFVVTCKDFAARFDDPAITVVNDGIGMDLAAKLMHGTRFQENLNGTDFIPRLLGGSPLPLRVFLFGARPEVVGEASRTVERRFGHEVVGALSGYGVDDAEVCRRIRDAEPDVVLVALGNPLQERWILDHAKALPPALYVGVGALFDFLAERAVRAPVWVRKLRLEWLFRLLQEPKRLWKRYTVDAVRFFRICRAARAEA
ncbi:WecB/TagA/CpsF family glycosyltransferase [Piscinibacter sp. HJYY11]|uniref:WecB/TagA/CpsF family glycosyltransferase n=1 Tax=Piscinibacter sp. HJYY11 TaxID=2801333 RepID=UPI00191C9867|nr:WecB/TagA/CpsF family glycosyltransferase [Piscinibacter sp. HJYY11]MBL0730699.1 WecB/TagA/CpsF family glycosyltransferase [Piscinibacter sp. HJYY11]